MAIMSEILATLMVIIYISVLIYIISLAIRLVRAVEKIANKIETSAKI
jgi:glycopeptide antibiotics resistance protein